MKKKVKEEIFIKSFEGQYAEVHFSDLPKDIQENDIIDIRRDEGHYSENNSYDPHTELVVIREREETDEECQDRMAVDRLYKEETRKRRYQQYLKLKAEFEQTI